MPTKRLIAGCMSGTSADGVDCAIVEVEGCGLAMTAKPLSHAYEAFSPELRKQILDVRQRGDVRLADLAEIGRRVTLAHVPAFRRACEAASVSASDIAAIAAHGQTLFHGPPNTIQYFDPSLLAFETGCAVVSDFRRADLAAGGQGAPLVPFADWILFRHPTKSRVILNIGGIANLTYLKAGGSIDEVIAFDTGPGNCISDWLMREEGGVDEGGKLALAGSTRAGNAVLNACLSNPYFKRPAPKSTDGPAMIAIFEAAVREHGADLPLNDQLAVAAKLVMRSTFDWLAFGVPLDEVFVCGGGVKNAAVMELLGLRAASSDWKLYRPTALTLSYLRGPEVKAVKDAGVDLAAAREAIAFALLAAATLDGEPSNVPSATGARRRVVLGSITPKPIHP